MSEQERPRHDDAGGGGLTGATGDLTPDASDESFRPAEWREAIGEGDEGNVTAAIRRESDAMHAGATDDPERLRLGDPHSHSTRDAGYGSEHGLAAGDPAYRVERHPSSVEAEQAAEAEQGELAAPAEPSEPAARSGPSTRLGGDVTRRPEDEHF